MVTIPRRVDKRRTDWQKDLGESSGMKWPEKLLHPGRLVFGHLNVPDNSMTLNDMMT